MGSKNRLRTSFKHGLSIAADPNADNVRALASLLAPPPCSDYLAALAIEAAIRIIDLNRVRDAHRILYEQIYAGCSHSPTLSRPARKPVELGEAVLKAIRAFTELERVPVPLLPDLAKQLDALARYDRRALSARERALAALHREMAAERLQTAVDEGFQSAGGRNATRFP